MKKINSARNSAGFAFLWALMLILSGCDSGLTAVTTVPTFTAPPTFTPSPTTTSMPTNTPTLTLPPIPASPQATPTPILPPATATTLELVGHLGGEATAVFGQGRYLYLGIGAELAILDVSDPTNPTRVGYTVLPDMATDIYVAGDYAYVTNGKAGLHVVDVSNPASPVKLSAADTPGDARGVVVVGSIAYVADGESGLGVFDVSEPTTPTELLFYDPGWSARGVVGAGNYLYVINEIGLAIVDVSDPIGPVEVGLYDSPEPLGNVALGGSYAYVVDAAALRVIDISDPTVPTEISFYATSEYMNLVYAGMGPGCITTSVVVEGSYAYVDFCGNLVLDISDPALPTLVSSSDDVAGPVELVMNGYAYVMGAASLHIMDISNLAAPKEVGLYQVPAWPHDIAVAGNYAYVAAPNNGLRVVDISDPAAPSEVSNLPSPGYIESVAVQGNYVYAAAWSSFNGVDLGVALQVIDISDPARPVEVGVSETVRKSFPGPTVWSMDVVDDYAYVGVSADGTFLWVVDISDPTAPVEVGFYSLQSAPLAYDDIAVVDNHAYVVGFAGLQVIDVSDPAAPTPVGAYTTDGISWSSVAVANNYAYLGAMYPNDLRVIDISDPTAPVEVGFYTPPADGREVAVAGSFAYILDEYHSGLRVVDISNPTTPIKVDFYDLPNPSQFDAIAVANGYVYAGAGAAGLYILRHGSTVSSPGLPICPDLPRPAMVFQAQNREDYILRHVASKSECTMQFEPPISRLLALTADGVYYSTRVTGEESTNQKLIHYANDGTLTALPFPDVDNMHYFVISSNGSQVAWSNLRIAKTTENERIVVSELYSAKADGSQVRLLHSVDNAAEVQRGAPYIGWIIQPVRFVDNGDLLFAVQPDGKGGAWNSFTGRYSNLYQMSMSLGEASLVYKCPVDDYSDCIGDISADSAYFAVTKREAGEITVFRMDGTPVATYSGPGQDYIGFPTFSPSGDLVFMSADVAEDQITVEQAYMSLVAKPYKKAAITLLREPLSFIWEWVDEQHILYTAVEDTQTQTFSPSLVNLDGGVERLPETYGYFLGVLSQ